MIETPELFCDEVEKFSAMELSVKSDVLKLAAAAANSLQQEFFFRSPFRQNIFGD